MLKYLAVRGGRMSPTFKWVRKKMGGEWGENKKANGAECKQLIKSNLIDLDNRYKGAALTTSL